MPLIVLRERGVVYHTECDVVALHCQGGSLRGATVSQRGITKEISGDYFVAALPVERMVELVTPELLASDPSLANLRELGRCVEWMNGIQFYLTERVPIAKGHVIYIDSPWALTSVSQAHFWREFPLESYADGRVVEVLSVDISDWDMPGLNGKAAKHCTKRQIALETWEQLKKSLNPARDVLQDRQLHSWFLDPGIDDRAVVAGSSRTAQCTNAEPLLVNYVDTWRLRPEAITRIRNLFLASDYVRTHTDLATMEAANEAARRAVNGILRAAHSDASPCALWDLHEPEAFIPLRAYDRQRFRRGLAWDGEALAFSESVARLSSPHRLNEHAGVASSASYANFARTPHEGVLRGLRIRSNS